jgi:hypothetical protein
MKPVPRLMSVKASWGIKKICAKIQQKGLRIANSIPVPLVVSTKKCSWEKPFGTLGF